MAKQLYYHVRTYSADGRVRTGSTYYGLSRAVSCLRAATGQPWPYQVIHRALKGAPLWASAYVVSPTALGPGGAYVCSIEEVSEGSSASISPYGGEGVVRLGETALPPDANPTPLDVLIEQAKQEVQAVEMRPVNIIADNKKPVDKHAGPGSCFECASPASSRVQGVCWSCIDAQPSLRPFLGLPAVEVKRSAEYRCAGNFHALPCGRLSSWQAKQYGCTCPKR